MSVRRRNVLALMLLAVAGLEFLARGPLRAMRDSGWSDFLSPYIQTRAWMSGQDPYSDTVLFHFWPPGHKMPDFLLADLARGSLAAKRGMPSPYPPTAFVLLAPIAACPWPIARLLWLLVNPAAFAVTLVLLVSLVGGIWRDWRTQFFVAFVLALAPFHTGLATENPVILVIALCVAGVWLAQRHRDVAAGTLFATGLSIKPTVAIPFFIFYLFCGRWKIAVTTCGVAFGVVVIASSRLWAAGVPWVHTYLTNSSRVFSRGSIDDFTPASAVWSNMVNLQVPFYGMVGSVAWANLLAFAVTALLLWVWLMVRNRSKVNELLALSTVVTICLLPVYHRFYDAALLVFPLAWSWFEADRQQQRTAWTTAALIAPFLIPGGTLLNQLTRSESLSSVLLNRWEWNSLVVAHEAWVILLLSLLLLHGMRSHARRDLLDETAASTKRRSVLHERDS